MRELALITLAFGLSACATTEEEMSAQKSFGYGKIISVEPVTTFSGFTTGDQFQGVAEENYITTIKNQTQTLAFFGKCPEEFDIGSEVIVGYVEQSTVVGLTQSDDPNKVYPNFVLIDCKQDYEINAAGT